MHGPTVSHEDYQISSASIKHRILKMVNTVTSNIIEKLYTQVSMDLSIISKGCFQCIPINMQNFKLLWTRSTENERKVRSKNIKVNMFPIHYEDQVKLQNV